MTLLALSTGTALAGGGNSAAAHACQKGGYIALVGSGGETFRNTGECVSFAARGGAVAPGDIELGSKVYGCFAQTHTDVTVGPFPTAVVLRVYLTDEFCGPTTYYSDGDHANVLQLSPTSWHVDIADAGGFCERQNDPV